MIVTPKEFAALKKRVEKQEDIIQVLKSVDCTVSAPLQDKLKALETLYGQLSVHTLCDALEVPRGTFYNHILRNKKENKSYQLRRTELSEQIRQIYDESDQILWYEENQRRFEISRGGHQRQNGFGTDAGDESRQHSDRSQTPLYAIPCAEENR